MRTIAWSRVGPGLAAILAIAPLIAQGATDDASCPASVPVLDAAVADCEPASATIGDITPDPTDDAAWIDPEGSVFYAEEATDLDMTVARIAASPVAEATETIDAFALHSLPGAARTIYLDFTGHTTSGTNWNSMAGGVIESTPFDNDGRPFSYSNAERALVRAVWQRVSEDYAPFNVDVTTQDPGTGALVRTDEQDSRYGIRVVVSPTNWYSSGVGGLAFVGSFTAATDTPAFVFADALGNIDRYIAEAATHEVGHSVGLRHDGTATSGYYTGHGDWAPIMGVGYDADIVQWSSGEYATANNTEDDLAIIGTYLSPVIDEDGGTFATARPLAIGSSATGIIGTRTDVDAFGFSTQAGRVTLVVRGAAPSPDLDTMVRLLDSDGRRIASANPSGTANATITKDLPAGNYTVTIDGVGWGNPTTGWSDYASIGRYTLSTSYTPPVTSSPTATFSTSRTTVHAGQTITFDGRASSDPDGGTITSWNWAIGGETTRTAATPTTSRTWKTPGSYPVRLTVTDDEGQSTTVTRTIVVAKARAAIVHEVGLEARSGRLTARLTVQVLDGRDHPVPSARVRIDWSGSASGSTTAVTDSRGVAVFPETRVASTGRVSARIVTVDPPAGYRWDGTVRTASVMV